jgi:phosphocarrier protein
MTADEAQETGRSGAKCLSGEVTIPNLKGLHARASAQFVKCAEKYEAEIRVTYDGHTVLGTSIMGLMMLAAGKGSTLVIEATGPHAPESLDALLALVGAGFHEDE